MQQLTAAVLLLLLSYQYEKYVYTKCIFRAAAVVLNMNVMKLPGFSWVRLKGPDILLDIFSHKDSSRYQFSIK